MLYIYSFALFSFVLATKGHFILYSLNDYGKFEINIITLNVRGIRNRVKRRSIFSYLKDQNCHFYLLQETLSEPKDERV